MKNEDEKIIHLTTSQLNQLSSQMNKSNDAKFEKIKLILIVAAILILIGVYLFNSKMEDAHKIVYENNKHLNLVLLENEYLQKNIKAMAGTSCYSCHNTPSMFLPKTRLSLQEFIGYTRGDRFVVNTDMPVYSSAEISDAELQNMWKILY